MPRNVQSPLRRSRTPSRVRAVREQKLRRLRHDETMGEKAPSSFEEAATIALPSRRRKS